MSFLCLFMNNSYIMCIMKGRPSLSKLVMIVVLVFAIMGIGFFCFNFFSKKAENSKALSELKQIQEIMLTNLMSTDGGLDEKITCDGVTFEYKVNKGRTVFSGSLNTNDGGKTFTEEIRSKFNELDSFKGSFNLEGDTITYTTENGKGEAHWVSGKLPSAN